ncbi:phosphoribosylformylglycinamidine synthase subunit PurS [Fodinibius sp. Rm-B-1B1-1]|uniref:phosphoribosylformylglycinamidine synthase subunit PurS n=1 Tax=Fodinibius alkaliphilus TaxID=3140241 RepID=UPI00315ABD6F
MYKATVNVTLRKSILDPQGKAAHNALKNLGLNEVNQVRIGKRIELDIDASDESEAQAIAEEACTKLLANEVMEDFDIEIHEN